MGSTTSIQVAEWTLRRKKIRPVFSLGQLALLFSVSDRRAGPTLSDQDRRDLAYPYLLELGSPVHVSGEYRLHGGGAWARELANRVWWVQTKATGPRLMTDLTEYERVLWEELAPSRPALEFQALV